MMRRLMVSLVLVPSLGLTSVLAAPAVQLNSGHPGLLAANADGTPAFRNAPHTLIWKEGQWFRLSHLGDRAPAPASRLNALRQSSNLPIVGGTWSSLGPQPVNSQGSWGMVSGRVTSLAVGPTSSQDIWVGAADGGVWHTINGGVTWKATSDTQPTLSTGSIALDGHAGTPYTVYVGTGESNLSGDEYPGHGILQGAYNSITGAVSWKNLGFAQFGGLDIAKVVVLDPDPNNANGATLLVATSPGAFPTPKGGGNEYNNMGVWRGTYAASTKVWTWTRTLHDSTGCGFDNGTDIVLDPTHPGTAYAGIANRFGYSSSSCASIAGVYKSTDSGQTWTQLTSGLPSGNDVERVALGISSDGASLYAAFSSSGLSGDSFGDLLNGSVYTSTTAGASWTSHAFSSSVSGLWYTMYLGVDPTNASTAYLGATDTWQTKNAASSWTNITNSYTGGSVHPDQHAMSFQSSSSSAYYLGNDGGIYGGTSGGTFTDLNQGGLSLTQFYAGSVGTSGPDAQLYGGSQDNGEDQYPLAGSGAAVWSEVYGGDGGFTAVDPTNNATVYEEYVNLQISKSPNGGASWSAATSGINLSEHSNFIAPFILSPNNHNELLAGTDRVYRTTDGAGSWNSISPVLDSTTPLSALAIAPGSDSTIYAGDNRGRVYATTNGGTTWSGRAIPGSTGSQVTGLSVDPTSPNTVYASLTSFGSRTGQHVFMSVNAGVNWTDISRHLPNIPCESVLVEPTNHNNVIVGTDAGIYITSNPGATATWSKLGTGLPNVVVDQIFSDGTSTLYVATHGRGMWKVALP